MDYGETVNLPQTPFPMRADMLQRQEEILRAWQAQDVYRTLLEDRRDARPFVIHDGPPYASGQVHVGIGMNKILKDFIAKFHSMNDRRVAFVPGWDCHGLPIELEVQRELGSLAATLSVPDMRKRCAEHALRYVREQKAQFQLLGLFADWERPYLTMNPSYEAGVLSVFLDMVRGGYVYRDVRPVAWCTSCRTALAEAEIDYRTVDGPSLWVHFEGDGELHRRCGAPADATCSLVAWTTTPWSLPGNAAVAAHSDYVYGAYAFRDKRAGSRVALLLEDRAAAALDEMGVGEHRKVGSVDGRSLAGLDVRHPLFDRKVPVILADFVRSDSGSGFVHVAPGHGLDDYTAGRAHGLQVLSPLDADGRFTAEAGPFVGMALREGEAAILAAMDTRGSLAARAVASHEQPHCWRCANPLVTRATPQWFIDVDHDAAPTGKSLRERGLLETEVVHWIPTGSRERIRGMLESRPDWCISRQRSWGVPLPAFHCRSCRKAILDPAAIGWVRDLVGEHGSAVWFERSAAELLPPQFACPECGGQELDKDENILDVWFESGTSWQSVLIADHRLSFPADLYVEGSDQHRGWFQLSLLPALVSRGKAPFNAVMTHGFVLNDKRQRMSRSGGDYVSLADALASFPADTLRLYFASVDTSADVPLSLETIRSVEPLYRTLRNTIRFLLGNLRDFVPREDAAHLDDLQPLDLWMLCRLHETIADVTDDYRAYRFHAAIRRVHDFCNEELSRIYFDAIKDRLYCDRPTSARRRSSQTVLHSLLVGLVKVLAPVLPYTCDEAWALTPGRADCPSVHLSRWPQPDEGLIHRKKSQDARDAFERFRRLREALTPALERLREQKRIKGSADAALTLRVADGMETFLGPATLADLEEFLMVAEVLAAPADAALEPVPGMDAAFLVEAATHPACPRCRRRQRTCGANAQHAELCQRCGDALERAREATLVPQDAERPTVETRPADLARFLRSRDVRRVAILNEGGRCRALALHSASQEVRPMVELQFLAEHVNASPDFRDHAALLLGLGAHTDVLFGIGIHHLNYGTPLGGTREFAYPRTRDMLDNLLRLSWGMSVKNAVAELPHGGGKSIIDTCGWDLKVHREFRREVYRDFGQFTATLFGRYICAEDVGNTNADTREMLSACRHVMCLSQGVAGSGNPSRFTALAAWAAAKAGWKFLEGTTSFEGLTIALQGAGNVGRNIVAILIEADPGIRKLIVGDRDPGQIQVIRNLLLKRGKEHLLEIVSSKDSLDRGAATAAYSERADEAGKDYVLYAPCDILIPAAVGNVINPANVGRLGCRLILPIANNVYSDNDTIAAAMFERNIVDVVENNVNWGGAMAAASELLGYDEDNVAEGCLEAYDKTAALLAEAKAKRCPPWHIVKERASRRIFHERHPAVAAARGYKFIGDISAGFADWIKQRWLRNVVDVDSDAFPRYAVDRAVKTRSA